MFALLAFLAFLIALFERTLGPIDLVVLGLAFLALHLIVPFTPWSR